MNGTESFNGKSRPPPTLDSGYNASYTAFMSTKYDAWYAKNGGARNKRRRERYANDPEYRSRAKGSSRPRRDAPAVLPTIPAPRRWSTVTYTDPETGVVETLFSVAALEAATGASQQALRNWEARGQIAKPDVRAPGGARLYRLTTIETIRSQIQAAGLTPRSRRDQSVTVRIRREGVVETVTLYPVSDLAVACSRRVPAVEALEREGIIPVTPFRFTVRRRRYYTQSMIASARSILQDILTKYPPGGVRVVLRPGTAATKEYTERLHAAWAPWLGAEVVSDEDGDAGGGLGGGGAEVPGGDGDNGGSTPGVASGLGGGAGEAEG